MRRALMASLMVAASASGLLLALGAMVALSESHAAPALMVFHARIQLVVGANAVLWVAAAAIYWWRGLTPQVRGLVAVVVGQLCIWKLGDFYSVDAWSVVPKVLGSIAVVSVPAAWRFLWLAARAERLRTHADKQPLH